MLRESHLLPFAVVRGHDMDHEPHVVLDGGDDLQLHASAILGDPHKTLVDSSSAATTMGSTAYSTATTAWAFPIPVFPRVADKLDRLRCQLCRVNGY